MSIKSLIQILILILITLIIVGVYYKYFDNSKNIVEEINMIELNNQDRIKDLENKISDLDLKNKELNKKLRENEKNSKLSDTKNNNFKSVENEKLNIQKKETQNKLNDKKGLNEKKKVMKDELKSKNEFKNLVKDVEYTSIDQRGNKFYLLANSGKSNINNSNILDLINVRGEITSDTRSTIYIVSDFAEYNSENLNSKFYENVKINYEDKEITCVNFDINMETNKAIAYNNVLITDPKSKMKAGIVEFDLKTKNININPQTSNQEVEVVVN